MPAKSAAGRAEYCKQYYLKNKEKIDDYRRRWAKENPRPSLSYRKWYLKKTYKISLEHYAKLLLRQDGKCAICERAPLEGQRKLAVDHCHKTGKVRGLLCPTCNHNVGFLESAKLAKAKEYLGIEAL